MSATTERESDSLPGSASGANQTAIEADGLCKYYGSFIAIDKVSFTIHPGEVVAFLGPNGAGKSTTMKLLTGYMTPTHGHARICGVDMAEGRLEAANRIGYLPENGPLYDDMTPRSLLSYAGRARGMSGSNLQERMRYVQERCDLFSVWEKPIGKLSKGYRQRVGMAQAILHDPEVLILDEPTSGLDPNQTQQARELIRDLGETRTILLSTHILSEVKAVCNRILLINAGRLVLDSTTDEFESGVEGLEARFKELTKS